MSDNPPSASDAHREAIAQVVARFRGWEWPLLNPHERAACLIDADMLIAAWEPFIAAQLKAARGHCAAPLKCAVVS